MKLTNKAAVELLKDYGFLDSFRIVDTLIEKGFIEADVVSSPEQYAQAARSWIGVYKTPEMILDRATGWDTSGWEVVIEEGTDIRKRQDIFKALKILEEDCK